MQNHATDFAIPHLALNWYKLCNQVLLAEDPKQKAFLTHHAWQKFRAGAMPIGQAAPPVQPARPAQPRVCVSASNTIVQPAARCSAHLALQTDGLWLLYHFLVALPFTSIYARSFNLILLYRYWCNVTLHTATQQML